MREIPLVNGPRALVDDAEYDALMQHVWYVVWISKSFYAQRQEEGHRIYMHRQIMGFPPTLVDHWDRNGLHNWRDNLRKATHSQNHANEGIRANNKSGFQGVHFHTANRKYVAQIKINYKNIYICSCDTAEEASEAYQKKKRELYGEFALPAQY